MRWPRHRRCWEGGKGMMDVPPQSRNAKGLFSIRGTGVEGRHCYRARDGVETAAAAAMVRGWGQVRSPESGSGLGAIKCRRSVGTSTGRGGVEGRNLGGGNHRRWREEKRDSERRRTRVVAGWPPRAPRGGEQLVSRILARRI